MNILMGIVIVLVLIVGGIIIAAKSRPKDFKVERSATTSASASNVYALLSDLSRFHEWSPWHKRDPNMKTEQTGGPGEVGSTHSWDGNKNVGAGKMTITKAEPPRLVEVKLEFFRPFAGTNQTFWRIEEEGAQRRIVWTMTGRNEKLMPQIMGLFMNMDKMIGKDFEDGLAMFKQNVERV